MTPGLSQHAPDVDTSGSHRQSWEPGSAADGPRTPGKMPSRRRSCPATRGLASSDSQRSSAPSLGTGGGPAPPVQQWVPWRCGGLSTLSAQAASGEFGQGGCGAAVSSAAGYTPARGGGRAGSPAGTTVGEGKKGGEEGAPGLAPLKSRELYRVAQGVRFTGPHGRGQLQDPRPPRPRSEPPPSPVPDGRRCPGSAGGRALARPGTAAPRREGGRRGAGPWLAEACSPAGPPRAARPPTMPGPAPAPGLSRNNLLEEAAERPQSTAGSSNP